MCLEFTDNNSTSNSFEFKIQKKCIFNQCLYNVISSALSAPKLSAVALSFFGCLLDEALLLVFKYYINNNRYLQKFLTFGVLDGDEKVGSVCVRRSMWVFSSRGMARGLLPRRGGTGGGRVLGGMVGGGVQGD